MKLNLKNWNFRLKAGIIILLLCFIFAYILPLFGDPKPEEWGTFFKNLKPSAEHILGTTGLGQDTFWLLCKSIRNSLNIGILVAGVSTIIGVIIGLIAGMAKGIPDKIITLFMDTFMVIPQLPILILIGSLMKGRTTFLVLAAIMIIFNWSSPARNVRSQALSIRERDFIDTARFSGESKTKILFKEMLPYMISWSVARFINGILLTIQTESSLAVIGMSNASWATLGTMIYWANSYSAMLMKQWTWILSPVVAMVIIFLGLFMTLSGYQQYNSRVRGK